MKRLTTILVAFVFLMAFFGCPSSGGGANVNPGGNEGADTGKKGGSSISDIWETAIDEVVGKTWYQTRNKAKAGGMGGFDDAGWDAEIYFDREYITLTFSLADNGVKGEGEEKLNKDYAKFCQASGAELKDGKIIFKQRMYIKSLYLPKLTKWLGYNGKEIVNVEVNNGDPANSEDNTAELKEAKTEKLLESYFKDGFKQGYPNLLIEADVAFVGTGSKRFERAAAVDEVAVRRPVRLLIKDGKLSFPKNPTAFESTAIYGREKLEEYFKDLLETYYSNPDDVFSCDDWPEFKADDGKFNAYAKDNGFQAYIQSIINEAKESDKRGLQTASAAYTWGYVTTSFGDTIFDEVFKSSKIKAVMPAEVENPDFDPEKPETPFDPNKNIGDAGYNPKTIWVPQELPPLFNDMPQDPENIAEANPNWTVVDALRTSSPSHGSRYIAEGFDTKNAVGEWKILYGDMYRCLPATLKIERIIEQESDWANADSSTELGKTYKTNIPSKAIDSDFNYDDASNWKDGTHKGKVKKYKLTYVFTLKFDEKELASDAWTKIFGSDKQIVGNEYKATYKAVDATNKDDKNYDFIYKVDPYNVMLKYDKTPKWIEFSEIAVYGIKMKETAANTYAAQPEAKLDLETLITGDTVLNNQSQFFIPRVKSGAKEYIDKITKIVVIPKHENVLFTLEPTGFELDTKGLGTAVTWEARINKDGATSILTNEADGTKEFAVTTNLDSPGNFVGKKLVIKLEGLGEHSNSTRKGVKRDASNYREDWQGYSFVIHFGR